MNIPAQFIGGIAMLLLFITYQINDRKKILLCQVAISICWIIHYTMLGAVSGLIINLICFARNLLFYQRDRRKWISSSAVPVAVCLLEIIMTLVVWKNIADLFALIGAPLQTAALWMKNPRRIRLIMISASPLWIVYDCMNGSYVGIATEILVMTSIIVSIVRYDIRGAASSETGQKQ